MTLDEAIQRENKIAEENQKIVDTEIVFDDVSLSQLYCDDTEVIEEHLENYKKCAEYHKKVAEWLEDYKRIKEEIGTDWWLKEHDRLIRNKAIDDFIKSEDYLMEKIKEEKAEVSIDYEWRKVVCLDDIRRMLHQGLLEIAEQLKAGITND